jgi:hypothetical protein
MRAGDIEETRHSRMEQKNINFVSQTTLELRRIGKGEIFENSPLL